MKHTILRVRRAVGTLLAALPLFGLLSTDAFAQSPVYKDAEYTAPGGRFARPPHDVAIRKDPACCNGGGPGYHRPVTGGPGYVGSVRGLGRPSYDGLAPAAGYGSYREHPTD